MSADRPHLAVLLNLLGDGHAQVGHGDAGDSEPELQDAVWWAWTCAAGAVKGGPGVAVALGWVLTGAESPERHALRGAVCGYLLAVQVGRELLGTAVSRMVLEGTSFAGGLALMAEALAGVAGLLAVAVASFGWAEGRRLVGSAGSAGELNRYLERRPEQAAEDLMVVLRYFNPMHFVPLVRGSTLVGVGLIDEVVPRRPWRPSPPRWAGHAR